jgi:uncharacterized protein (TIGR02266 family)
MTQDDRRDRRRNPRHELVLKVEYEPTSGLPADYLTDLGEDGLFLCTSEPFEPGQSITFSLSFPGLLAPIPARGVVRWRSGPTEDQPDAPCGVGVQFTYDGPDHRTAIRAVLAALRGEPAPAKAAPVRFRVLLVEDNEFAHKLFHHAVKRFHAEWGGDTILEIVSAKDGLEALELLDRGPIDLALVDFFLPAMNGGDLIRKMRSDTRWAQVPVLVISVGGIGVREDAIAAGADLYLDKPVLLKQLLTTLHALLAARAEAQPAAVSEESYR